MRKHIGSVKNLEGDDVIVSYDVKQDCCMLAHDGTWIVLDYNSMLDLAQLLREADETATQYAFTGE